MGERLDSLVRDETKRQIVAALLFGAVMMAGSLFEDVSWTLRILIGIFTVIGTLWLQDRYRAQINRFFKAYGYSVNPSATLPQAQQDALAAQLSPRPHYSASDRDRISEAFFDLSEILKKQAEPMHRDLMNLINAWEKVRGNDTSKEIARTMAMLDEVDKTSGEIKKAVHEDLVATYQRYDSLLNEVLGLPGELPSHRVRMMAIEFKHCLKASGEIYENVPNQKGQIYILMNPMIRRMLEAATNFNGWISDTNKRIKTAEAEILR